MDQKEHKDWLRKLAAEDRSGRARAEPELYRKEALLRSAQAKLDATRAAVGELEASLEAARRQEAESEAELDTPQSEG